MRHGAALRHVRYVAENAPFTAHATALVVFAFEEDRAPFFKKNNPNQPEQVGDAEDMLQRICDQLVEFHQNIAPDNRRQSKEWK